jgi:uncharacterized membrane protein
MPDRTVDLRLPAITVMSLTAYDAVTTTVALGGAGGTELNPLIGALIGTVGLAPAMAVRAIAGMLLVLLLVRFVQSPRSRVTTGPLWAAAAVLGAVAVWNTWMLIDRGPWGIA